MAKKTKTYWVDIYRNGFCYRSVSGCPWSEVRRLKKIAKMWGETVTYEEM